MLYFGLVGCGPWLKMSDALSKTAVGDFFSGAALLEDVSSLQTKCLFEPSTPAFNPAGPLQVTGKWQHDGLM